MNGNGEMTGLHWIREAGWFTGPVTITNTFAVGLAHHATIRWMVNRFPAAFAESLWVLPVAAETYDGWLSDIAAQAVTEAHVIAAIDGARGGPVAEGNVGGGTGMIAYEFKGGTGTASRLVDVGGDRFTVGVLVQANHGIRPWLQVCGRPVGQALGGGAIWTQERGSIIVVVATDAPCCRRNSTASPGAPQSASVAAAPRPQQLRRHLPRIQHRERSGTAAGTGQAALRCPRQRPSRPAVPGRCRSGGRGRAQRDAAAEPMVGRRGRRVEALDGDQVVRVLAQGK